ncbi:hypothetical protein COB47_0362 [Caldicellulosiruptor obsidiansis OB47]|uniref:Uncharacterized protein n=1 Tax=Caldicellulosiruptor obsidiansis (strain ATCC BAA-2073 / JCM 16842 / OB47) TaxID=608506 RepID=D9TI68_CALOO|nr:hypothetical protein [Caldicellulosiruptor obsidiansis]ADL41700.1 hypothetical protein COB47_0362 [Caldicellulosiruptor obsidiansis OB47]
MYGKEIEIGGKKLAVANEILRSPEGKIYFIVEEVARWLCDVI